MPKLPWPDLPPTRAHFTHPPREYGILPFWFLNGELDPEEMRYQLYEFRDKGMPGIILHGRFGLEMPYIGPTYLERIKHAVEEAEKLGLKTWIYDEMNWPSGTADQRVLQERPDLAQRYLECISFNVRGPWFTYLTGQDSRYLDFERSKPVAAFALSSDGEVIDLTPNLSFEKVIPWEAPPGNWRLMYIVEKEADYYIDALNPEATAEFLRLGYDPYAEVVSSQFSSQMPGFYTDEPAMHYYLTGGDNPIVPWTKGMFRRFYERNGYSLRRRLPDLFFDINPDSGRLRYDFYNTLTELYSEAYYKQIHEWCQKHDVLFTGHLLYEEWLRKMIRVEGNLFKHYAHMDIIGVDHLYPFIGNRDRPDEHVAIKVASSAAHQMGSERLLCESFGGIFMDATMQRMKWITDWEYVLGVNLLNPHGFHYTLEGPRKRDWPPSMFYQYPWWHYYETFSDYVSRLSHLLTGGHHVAKVAMIWPINTMFATYTPQDRNPLAERIENDFNVLTDLLLRLHYDFDYLDEDMLANEAELEAGTVRMRDESYELLILPPMTHIKISTVERIEQFVAQGGRVLSTIFLPDKAFGKHGLIPVGDRIQALFGIDPIATQKRFRSHLDTEYLEQDHPGGGKCIFLRSYALARQLPLRLQKELGLTGQPESPHFVIEQEEERSRYWYAPPDSEREEITEEVEAERLAVANVLHEALEALITPDLTIDNPEIFYLHRVKDGKDLYFFINPTYEPQAGEVTLTGQVRPLLWEPSTGTERPVAPYRLEDGRTHFQLALPPVGSAFIVTDAPAGKAILDTNLVLTSLDDQQITGYGRTSNGYLLLEQAGERLRLDVETDAPAQEKVLDGEWAFTPFADNALVIDSWIAKAEGSNTDVSSYTTAEVESEGWTPMSPGAWSFQLPTEPETTYPIPVWYRAEFYVDELPSRASLLIDGFAGSDWRLFVNGDRVDESPVRSQFDSQIEAVGIAAQLKEGRNIIALRLTLREPTDGLLDLLKIVGDFSLARGENEQYRITGPRRHLSGASWTEQGYPFYSGRAAYRRTFELPEPFEGQRIFLEPAMNDDVLEVIVNGERAGIRLWPPYGIDITDLLQPGENTLELHVANTLINLLEGVDRASGLAGAPRLVPYNEFTFELEESDWPSG